MVRTTGSDISDCGSRIADWPFARDFSAPRPLSAIFKFIMPDEPILELPGLRVTVDRVVHVPHLDAPEDRPHPFVYFITIHNESEQAVTIRGRKWVVTDDAGQRLVVEGDGVVGKFPRLEPGEDFSYNSYHTIGAD